MEMKIMHFTEIIRSYLGRCAKVQLQYTALLTPAARPYMLHPAQPDDEAGHPGRIDHGINPTVSYRPYASRRLASDRESLVLC
jgi:hypothetical protein